MKGKVETTIPQRQYENIKTTYYFENEDERKAAIEQSIQDCLDYANIVGHKAKVAQEKARIETGKLEDDPTEGLEKRYKINEVLWRKLRGVWGFWNKEKKKWIMDNDGLYGGLR